MVFPIYDRKTKKKWTSIISYHFWIEWIDIMKASCYVGGVPKHALWYEQERDRIEKTRGVKSLKKEKTKNESYCTKLFKFLRRNKGSV